MSAIKDARSVPVPAQLDNIPEELRRSKRWVAWLARWDGVKLNKRPGRIDRPGVGLTNWAEAGWVDFDTAAAAYNANRDVFGGVGYVMSHGPGVTGVDLDHCIDSAGAIAPWASEIVDKLDSYTEVSPSGTGLRVFVSGEVEDWQARGEGEVAIEVYGGAGGRFLTVTGARVAGTPAAVRAPRTGIMAGLRERYYKAPRKTAEIEDLHLPDVVPEAELPDIADLGLPARARNFLTDGPTSSDRSGELFYTAIELVRAGLTREVVFSVLANNEYALEIAERHWSGNADKALRFLWKHSALKGEARAKDFERLRWEDLVGPDEAEDVSDLLGPNPEPAAPETPGTVFDEFEVLDDEVDNRHSDLAPVKAEKKARFAILKPSEFLLRRPADWLVKGIVPRAGLGVIYGASGSGKTFLTLDLVGALVRGAAWRGATVRRCRVLYVVAEGASGFRNRMAAYCAFHGVDPDDIEIGVLPDAPNIREKADIKDLLAAIKVFGRVDVIVIDTYARAMAGGNENDAKDVGEAIAHCDVLHRVTGALVLLVHHSGKDATKGARGSGALRAAADLEIEVVQTREYRAATITKQKDGEDGQEYRFKLQEVEIGRDDDDEPITSCVVAHMEGVAPKSVQGRRMTPMQETVISTLDSLIDLSDGPIYPEELKRAAVGQIPRDPTKKKDNRHRDVGNAIGTLIEAGDIFVGDMSSLYLAKNSG